VAVEGFEGGFEFDRELERIEFVGFAAAFFGHLGADVLPDIAEDGDLGAGDVIGDGDAGKFNDAALDGVHEREICNGPGEEGAGVVTGAAEEEGGGGEIKDAGDADFLFDGFEA